MLPMNRLLKVRALTRLITKQVADDLEFYDLASLPAELRYMYFAMRKENIQPSIAGAIDPVIAADYENWRTEVLEYDVKYKKGYL